MSKSTRGERRGWRVFAAVGVAAALVLVLVLVAYRDVYMPGEELVALGCTPFCCLYEPNDPDEKLRAYETPFVPARRSYYYSGDYLRDNALVRQLEFDAVALQAGDVVADLGSGIGTLSVLLAERVGPSGMVHATDLGAPVLETLERTARDRGLTNIRTTRVMEPRELGLSHVPDGTLRAAYIINSVGFMPSASPGAIGPRSLDPADVRWLEELRRKLKPGGEVVYYLDWIDELFHDRGGLVELFTTAGYAPEVRDVPLPSSVPEATCYCPGTSTPRVARRGHLLVFRRPGVDPEGTATIDR